MDQGEKKKPAARFTRLTIVPDINAEFTLSEEQKASIQECIRKGTLRVSVKSDQVSLIGGDLLGDAYLWD